MKINKRQSGVTFMEMTVVVAVVALLVGVSIPAVRALRGSFESEGGTKAMINSAWQPPAPSLRKSTITPASESRPNTSRATRPRSIWFLSFMILRKPG